MSGEERRLRIVEHLRATETETVEGFSRMFGVSGMTVHRDLDALVEQRILRKIRGGATILPSVLFEGDYAYRERLNVAEKTALARAAAELVEPGMAVMMDDSSTVAAVVPQIVDRRPLTVVTNAVPVLRALETVSGISVVCLGGTWNSVTNAYLGMITEQAARSMRVDLALFSTACVHGTTAYLRDLDGVVRAKHAMMESSDRNVLLVDHAKFGKSALHRFADLTSFESVLTTDGLRRETRETLRRARVRLRIVRSGGAGAGQVEQEG